MKVSELRIGNYVLDQNKEWIVKVDGIDCTHDFIVLDYANGSAQYSRRKECVLPIPLTEEWLLKLGFEKLLFKNDNYIYNINILYLMLSDSTSYGCTFDPENDHSWFREVQHVHQLQNLYFALTGKELEVKL